MNKNIVIIVSGGRTGPRFFADPLSKMAEDSYSVREPDLFEALTRRTWRRLEVFGLSHMVIGRLLGGTRIGNVSQEYLSGRLNLNTLAPNIRWHRLGYYNAPAPSLIIESHHQ